MYIIIAIAVAALVLVIIKTVNLSPNNQMIANPWVETVSYSDAIDKTGLITDFTIPDSINGSSYRDYHYLINNDSKLIDIGYYSSDDKELASVRLSDNADPDSFSGIYIDYVYLDSTNITVNQDKTYDVYLRGDDDNSISLINTTDGNESCSIYLYIPVSRATVDELIKSLSGL